METRIAAVLTTQFLAKSTERTVRSLRVLSQLLLDFVVVVTDEKDPCGRELAEDAIESMQTEFADAGMRCEVFDVNCYSTARRWWPGLCRAFAEEGMTAALNFPGDLETDLSPEQVTALLDGVRHAGERELVLFDYDSTDPFKQSFDQEFLLPLTTVVHPELVPHIEDLKHSKLRTEMFCVGRETFTSLRGNLGISWGTDPTIQLLWNSLKNGFDVRSVPIGSCDDARKTRSDPARRALQITRIGHQILNDAIISSSYGGGKQAPLTSEEVETLAAGVYAEIERCLLRNRKFDVGGEHHEASPDEQRNARATQVAEGTAQGGDECPSTPRQPGDTTQSSTPKLDVTGVDATFAPFAGYSLLFDNPAATYQQRGRLLFVNCTGEHHPPFYRKLFKALAELDVPQLRTSFSLCPLAPESAHCTCLDGHNVDNLGRVDPSYRNRIEAFINGLPDSMDEARDTLSDFFASRLATEQWPIDFIFDKLAIRGGTAFIATLKPADKASETRLEELKKARLEFDRQAPRLGLSPRDFVAHVSLAYFADPQLGASAESKLPRWTSRFEKQLRGTRLSFQSVSLHAFTDMITFFRLP